MQFERRLLEVANCCHIDINCKRADAIKRIHKFQ